MSGSGLGPAGVMVMLGIADDARVCDLTAEQRGQITDAIAATSQRVEKHLRARAADCVPCPFAFALHIS
ncbi:hypothetical protein [Rhodococcus opacus]|jgi:hypothetical protein|uniref:IclR-ED domain-containing protein n=1 Tax=Rhodococcus opacus TaxID=37919 RepID=A0AAX3YRV0_RHOOP|nr:hypothetical protein [Rhodococcus opacus]MCZ4586042.1 hypothetical protein [Rhodococcus opacus]MDV6245427.1 hypothetical protein [Rhodococcus opacus]WLF52011.1 hypothetical protein Q5707_41925 [Rhodococcus opacus]